MKPDYIQTNTPLAPLTTLGVGGNAEYFVKAKTIKELTAAIKWAQAENFSITTLGGGSNVLVDDEGIKGLVIRPDLRDVSYTNNGDTETVYVGAGVVFDNFVEEVIERGLWGLENLSGIPGSVGATPIQNVGAYGTEVKDCIVSVHVYDTEDRVEKTLSNNACAFEYRGSLFKKELGRYIILGVTFMLSHEGKPNTEYKDLQNYFPDNSSPSLQEIRAAVLDVRSKKFPDWRVLGTAGSFFKNPIISKEHAETLKATYPELPIYEVGDERVKVSLGFVLDKICGLKGFHEGSVRLFEHQALVLVCEKGTSSDAIRAFAKKVSEIVFEKTKIKIEKEVTFL